MHLRSVLLCHFLFLSHVLPLWKKLGVLSFHALDSEKITYLLFAVRSIREEARYERGSLPMASSVNSPTQRETTIAAAQTEVPRQAPPCPLCQKTDQVRTLQAAFDLGIEPIAPPALPTSNARMMPWVVTGFFIYLTGNFYLFIELAANSQNRWPMAVQILSFVINLLGLIVGLVLSYMAILRVARGDRKVTACYPTWDRAMTNWRHLYYCLRDRAIIDPQQKRVLSDAELRSLIRTDDQEPRKQNELFTHGDIHRPSADISPSNE